MKKIKQYLISMFLIILLINTAYGFPGMTGNISTTQPGLINSTESDQNIVLVQSLIEVDAVQLKSENKLFVRETSIFKNQGAMNFSGKLRTWLADGAEVVSQKETGAIVNQSIVQRRSMMDGTFEYALQPTLNGNILSWQDNISVKSLPPLFIVEYVLPAEPKGTISKTKQYSKMFLYPTLVTKKPNSIVLKITLNKEESAAIKDENGNSISSSGNPREEGNSILYGWESPQFNEMNVAISSSTVTPSGIAGYVILGLLIILVFSYPFIRKKNEKIRSLEEKIRNSFKRKETVKETTGETGGEVAGETITPEPVETEDTEFEGKTREELEVLKDETLSKLSELQKEYESGNMLDEEYEELRNSNQKRIDKISKRIEKSG
ncbi:MAG: hypothetical protein O8C62_03855 [Candidatus Methanoperedens sp.]|nr:hypothetical protein [Candidatus Methanoperedens sp.]